MTHYKNFCTIHLYHSENNNGEFLLLVICDDIWKILCTSKLVSVNSAGILYGATNHSPACIKTPPFACAVFNDIFQYVITKERSNALKLLLSKNLLPRFTLRHRQPPKAR
jgi:hypothetical protein